jgi:hypothetical protein
MSSSFIKKTDSLSEALLRLNCNRYQEVVVGLQVGFLSTQS